MNQPLDLASAIQFALALAAFLGGWLLKVLFARIDKLEQADAMQADKVSLHIDRLEATDAQVVAEVANTRLDLARNYVPRADLQHIVAPIYDTLRRIEDKLDKKADKEGP